MSAPTTIDEYVRMVQKFLPMEASNCLAKHIVYRDMQLKSQATLIATLEAEIKLNEKIIEHQKKIIKDGGKIIASSQLILEPMKWISAIEKQGC